MNKNIINLLLALPIGTSVSDAQERADILKNRTDVIPAGNYCYTEIKIGNNSGVPVMKNVDCPYLARSTSHSEQYSGYCALKRLGDWENKNTLLWDKVKECDHNETDYLALAKRYDHYKLLPKITNAEQAYERALYQGKILFMTALGFVTISAAGVAVYTARKVSSHLRDLKSKQPQ